MIENIRLKRQVEQVENGKIAELNTEIERLKEVDYREIRRDFHYIVLLCTL